MRLWGELEGVLKRGFGDFARFERLSGFKWRFWVFIGLRVWVEGVSGFKRNWNGLGVVGRELCGSGEGEKTSTK